MYRKSWKAHSTLYVGLIKVSLISIQMSHICALHNAHHLKMHLPCLWHKYLSVRSLTHSLQLPLNFWICPLWTQSYDINADNDAVHVWPTPAQVANTSIEKLRTAGLSQRKAEYIQGLAEKFVSGELSTEMLLKASDEEVMEKLIAVRGLGKWSVEM